MTKWGWLFGLLQPHGRHDALTLALSRRAGEGTDVAGEVVSAVVKGAGDAVRELPTALMAR